MVKLFGYKIDFASIRPETAFFIVSMIALPFVWFLDVKYYLTALFKSFNLKDFYDADDQIIYFKPILQVIVYVVGIAAYFKHRRWIQALEKARRENLLLDGFITDTKEFDDMKRTLVPIINAVQEECVDIPRRFARAGLKPERKLGPVTMEDLRKAMEERFLENERRHEAEILAAQEEEDRIREEEIMKKRRWLI